MCYSIVQKFDSGKLLDELLSKIDDKAYEQFVNYCASLLN